MIIDRQHLSPFVNVTFLLLVVQVEIKVRRLLLGSDQEEEQKKRRGPLVLAEAFSNVQLVDHDEADLKSARIAVSVPEDPGCGLLRCAPCRGS